MNVLTIILPRLWVHQLRLRPNMRSAGCQGHWECGGGSYGVVAGACGDGNGRRGGDGGALSWVPSAPHDDAARSRGKQDGKSGTFNSCAAYCCVLVCLIRFGLFRIGCIDNRLVKTRETSGARTYREALKPGCEPLATITTQSGKIYALDRPQCCFHMHRMNLPHTSKEDLRL